MLSDSEDSIQERVPLLARPRGLVREFEKWRENRVVYCPHGQQT